MANIYETFTVCHALLEELYIYCHIEFSQQPERCILLSQLYRWKVK